MAFVFFGKIFLSVLRPKLEIFWLHAHSFSVSKRRIGRLSRKSRFGRSFVPKCSKIRVIFSKLARPWYVKIFWFLVKSYKNKYLRIWRWLFLIVENVAIYASSHYFWGLLGPNMSQNQSFKIDLWKCLTWYLCFLSFVEIFFAWIGWRSTKEVYLFLYCFAILIFEMI